MRARLIIGVVVAVVMTVAHAVSAHATNEGLYIAPLRQDVKLAAGTSQEGKFVVGNHTDKAMTVKLSVKRFSMTEFAYSYEFYEPTNDWVAFAVPTVTLQPGEQHTVDFSLRVPANEAAGGYYFTLIASTSVRTAVTVQAATLLYVSVDGGLMRSIEIQDSKIPEFASAPSIPYQFDAKDTGNVYVNASFFASLNGRRDEAQYTLLPDIPRRIAGSLPAPFWPGVYRVTYGFKAEYMTAEELRTATIIYVPPWVLMLGGAFLGAVLWLVVSLWKRRW